MKCEHDDCEDEGAPCWSDLGRGPDVCYCAVHAHENGFCPGCGVFWAGNEQFDSSASHLCQNCTDDLMEPHADEDEYA